MAYRNRNQNDGAGYFILAVILLIAILSNGQKKLNSVESHLNSNDLLRLQKVFVDGLNSNDLQSIFYSTLNIEPTNAAEKEVICKTIATAHSESKLNDFEKNFYLVGAHKNLRCTTKIPEAVLTKVSTSLSKDVTLAQEMYFNLMASKMLGVQIDVGTSERLSNNLKNILKKDDALTTLGYSFFISSEMAQPMPFVVDRVEDAIVQADEVDGKMLQFEGGLSITALIINGVFRVPNGVNKRTPITNDQAVKFATYFLSRRSVQTAKGAHVLIEALKTLSQHKSIAPNCIQIVGNGQLSTNSPTLNIKVVDLLGKPLSKPPLTVYGKIAVQKSNTILAERVSFISKSSDKTVFSADLSSFKPSRGIYTIDINTDDYTQSLTFKVLGRVNVHSLELGVGDSDSTSALKKQSISYPTKISQILSADHTQKVVLKVVLTEEGTTKVISVHQAFVRIANKQTDEEIIFVAEQDTSKAYKFDMDVGSKAPDFRHRSGLYSLELIVGDASITNSFAWHVADIQLKFPNDESEPIAPKGRSSVPHIEHKFRVPDKRPSRFVSDIFTGLCLTPLVLLIILWGKLGINISNFTFRLSTIGFHLGLGSILTLFGIFWLQLNMFETIRYLIPIAIFTFLCGNRLLRSIANI